MLTLSDNYGLELHAQHSLRSADYLQIAQLASHEAPQSNNSQTIFEQLSTFTFEQFFGFTCHLFITTDSSETREQLSLILPSFGSIAVLSLLKIANHFYPCEEVKALALKSLQHMPNQPLAVGIGRILEGEIAEEMRSAIAHRLVQMPVQRQEQILRLLAEQLSLTTWEKLEAELSQGQSNGSDVVTFDPHNRRIKIRIKNNEEQPAEIAC
ncbi:MAG: hypothetical protein AAFP20_16375 [Cyanobacteria bacterium J06614_10]